MKNYNEPFVKETDYCIIKKQAFSESEGCFHAVEKIFVKGSKRDEIRFAYYKMNENTGNKRIILRPLDLTEDDLLTLMRQGLAEDVFSKDFIDSLKFELNNYKK
ncbi:MULTISPECIES: hypothetical protein [Bacillus cereus group]|uniref:hypothetical protein n=1 Tax=Bacillus cereus group TaxID=86661 RepID=UPI0008C52D9A|nr:MULTISPECIES: hypothetical protein [Bacillus cereus group]PEM52038.1 hypothetical protein CN618_10045 [Bacillus wiedmannii]SEJ69701.1 hypothetical protein SAMN04487780_11323 [Bacillus thuringiensis]